MGVLPFLTTCFGPRTEAAGLKGSTCPVTRYGIKKNGYHGGLSPQEIVVPIAVLSASSAFPSGWVEAAADLPGWWDVMASSSLIEPPRGQTIRTSKPKEKPAGRLFDPEEESVPPLTKPAIVPEATTVVPDWVQALLVSAVFEEQKRLGGRAVPANDVFARLLMVIDERSGKITSPALARAIQFSPMRLCGFLATAQRVLNVDGFLVLNRDEVSDTIALDRNLLCRQFDLPKGAP